MKHWFYCPRIVYFERAIGARAELGSQQEEALEIHSKLSELDKRRTGGLWYSGGLRGAEKEFGVALSSKGLGLRGVIDCVLKLGGEAIPLEYKAMASNKGRAWPDHKYQLVAYALLIEENYGSIVKRGFIFYEGDGAILEIEITPVMKAYVRRAIGRIWEALAKGEPPPIRVPKAKCSGGCGLKWICRPA
ncbi:MAG: CRISPR-associated protein Cas4 [Candidatus Bathyarchaeia archaeon]